MFPSAGKATHYPSTPLLMRLRIYYTLLRSPDICRHYIKAEEFHDGVLVKWLERIGKAVVQEFILTCRYTQLHPHCIHFVTAAYFHP